MLVELGNDEADAVKVSATVVTALTWLVNNVPEAAVPAALQPAFELVKSVVPYLGYIGGFIAWSWDEIQSFDTGNGVTLTATWLLPIALIPGTWEDDDVPSTPSSTTTPSTSAIKAPTGQGTGTTTQSANATTV